jgi:tetratricopeptide (TPR) repeat protein
LRAGENSNKLFAFREALDFFSRALNLSKQAAANLTEQEDILANYRMQILAISQQGRVYRSLGDMQSYQNVLEEEARLARLLKDKNALAYVHIHEANAHRWFCRYPQAQESAEKALKIGRDIKNPLLQARALREMGLAARAVGDFSKAQAFFDQALKLFNDMHEVAYEIHTLCNLSTLYTYMDDFRYAEKLATRALERCEQAQLPLLRRIPLGDLGVALAELGLIDQGRECLLTSLEVARQIADRSQEIFCLCHLGWLEIRSGRLEQAISYLRDGLALAERLDSRAEQSRLYAGIAETHRLLGNARLANSLALKALDLAKRHGRLHDQALVSRVIPAIRDGL